MDNRNCRNNHGHDSTTPTPVPHNTQKELQSAKPRYDKIDVDKGVAPSGDFDIDCVTEAVTQVMTCIISITLFCNRLARLLLMSFMDTSTR